MAKAAEYYGFDEQAVLARHLRNRKKDKAQDDEVDFLEAVNMNVMVAMVSRKDVEHIGEERETGPVAYNHPSFLCDPEEVEEIANLPALTAPTPSEPLLHCKVNLADEAVTISRELGLRRRTDIYLDRQEIASHLAHDCITGYIEFRDRYNTRASGIPAGHEIVPEAKRGRNTERNSSPAGDAELSKLDRSDAVIHRPRHSQSLPPAFDPKLHTIKGEATDPEELRHEVIDRFRKVSELHVLRPGPKDKPLKLLGYGEGNFTPRDVYVEAYKFAIQRRRLTDSDGTPARQLVPENATRIRDYLRHSLHYFVTREMVMSFLFSTEVIVSAGQLPYNAESLNAEEDRKAKSKGPSKSKPLQTPAPDPKHLAYQDKVRSHGADKRSESEKKAEKEKKRKRPNETSVYMSLHDNPAIRQYARLAIRQYYLDRSKPGEHPFKEALVNINERNARREQYDLTEGVPPPSFYTKAITLHDVSAAAYEQRLTHMFRHVIANDPKYFANLRMSLSSSSKLWLMSLPHNNNEWSSNLRPIATDQPSKLTAFASVLAHQPQVFILFRASKEDATNMRSSMAKQFQEQTWHDPLRTTILVKPQYNDSFTSSSFLPIGSFKSFSIPAESSFQTFLELELRLAGGVVYEHDWSATNGRDIYTGDTVVLPVAKAFREEEKVYMAFAGAMTLEPECAKKNPALQKGDRLDVWIDSNCNLDRSWIGVVCDPFPWTNLDQISFWVHRRVEKGEIQDLRNVQTMNPGEIDKQSPEALHKLVQQAKPHPIVATLMVDDQEKKRRLKAINLMRVSNGMRIRDPERAQSLLDSQQMFKCNDHQQLPRSGIYDTLVHGNDDDTEDPAFAYVQARLEPQQLHIHDDLVDGGLANKTAVVTGISGSGKSYLLRVLGLPYIGGRVTTNNTVSVRRNLELSYLQLAKKERQDIRVSEHAGTEYELPQPPEIEILRPSFDSPTNLDYEPHGTVEEKARSLYVAAGNDTVDALYASVRREALAFTEATGRSPPLMYRRYAKATEISAVKACLHPDFWHGTGTPRYFRHDVSIMKDGNNQTICNAFERHCNGSDYFGIRDSRFTEWQSSMSYLAVQLSLPNDEQCPELLAAFTNVQRAFIRRKLRPFRTARNSLRDTGEWTRDLSNSVEEACKYAFDWLDYAADIVVATSSAASEHRFALHRQPHFIGVEEAGRLDDAMLMTFYSLYHSAVVRILVGDYRQIGVQLFGEQSANPFFYQLRYPLLGRLRDTGFKVPDLRTTRRFANEELLELVQLVNRDSSIRMGDGAEQAEASLAVRAMHLKIFGGTTAGLVESLTGNTSTIFINCPESDQKVMKSSRGSPYNTVTATITVDYVKKLLKEGLTGKQIVVTSPYYTQTHLHSVLLKAAARQEKPEVARHLLEVRCSTIDSYMGEECFYHVHDSCSRTGHVFTLLGRAVVVWTRATHGMAIIGSFDSLKGTRDGFRWDHPVKNIMRHLEGNKRFVTLTDNYVERVNTYNETIHSFGGGKTETLPAQEKDTVYAARFDPHVFDAPGQDPFDDRFRAMHNAIQAELGSPDPNPISSGDWGSIENADNAVEGWGPNDAVATTQANTSGGWDTAGTVAAAHDNTPGGWDANATATATENIVTEGFGTIGTPDADSGDGKNLDHPDSPASPSDLPKDLDDFLQGDFVGMDFSKSPAPISTADAEIIFINEIDEAVKRSLGHKVPEQPEWGGEYAEQPESGSEYAADPYQMNVEDLRFPDVATETVPRSLQLSGDPYADHPLYESTITKVEHALVHNLGFNDLHIGLLPSQTQNPLDVMDFAQSQDLHAEVAYDVLVVASYDIEAAEKWVYNLSKAHYLPVVSEPRTYTDVDAASMPADSDSGSQPADTDAASMPADSDSGSQPADIDVAPMPADSGSDSQPADIDAQPSPAVSPSLGNPFGRLFSKLLTPFSRKPTDMVREPQDPGNDEESISSDSPRIVNPYAHMPSNPAHYEALAAMEAGADEFAGAGAESSIGDVWNGDASVGAQSNVGDWNDDTGTGDGAPLTDDGQIDDFAGTNVAPTDQDEVKTDTINDSNVAPTDQDEVKTESDGSDYEVTYDEDF